MCIMGWYTMQNLWDVLLNTEGMGCVQKSSDTQNLWNKRHIKNGLSTNP